MSETTGAAATVDTIDDAAESEGHRRRWATWVEKGVRENRQAERRVRVFAAVVMTVAAAAVLFRLW